MNVGHCNHLFLLEVKADAGLHIHGKAGLFAVAAGVGEDGGTIGQRSKDSGGPEPFKLLGITGDTVNAQLPQQRPGDVSALQLFTEGRPLADGQIDRASSVLPQIAPAFCSAVLYRFDVNIREASVLGLVGAGGIGAPLIFAMNQYDWNKAGAILLGLILLVWGVDILSSRR